MPKKTKTRKPVGRIDVRESGVHGRGVYATQFIPEGTRIIEYTGQRGSWESAPNEENNPHTFNFGLESGEVINPQIGAATLAGSTIAALQTAKPSRKTTAFSSTQGAISKLARNSFTITRWKSTNP